MLEAMFSEAITTLILVLTVLITTLDKKKRRLSPLAIGFSIIVCSVTRYGVFLKIIFLILMSFR